MGKNKRRQIEFYDSFHQKDMMLDSNEEVDAFNWLIEAQKLGIVKDWIYQPPSIMLFESVDYINSEDKKRNLFRDHVYSADFIITFDPTKVALLAKEFKLTSDQTKLNSFDVMIDVKGTFNKTERAFSLNQKWVYQKTGIYVYKLIPKDFFKKAGCPQASFMTRKTNKSRKIYVGYKSISEIFGLK